MEKMTTELRPQVKQSIVEILVALAEVRQRPGPVEGTP